MAFHLGESTKNYIIIYIIILSNLKYIFCEVNQKLCSIIFLSNYKYRYLRFWMLDHKFSWGALKIVQWWGG